MQNQINNLLDNERIKAPSMPDPYNDTCPKHTFDLK